MESAITTEEAPRGESREFCIYAIIKQMEQQAECVTRARNGTARPPQVKTQ